MKSTIVLYALSLNSDGKSSFLIIRTSLFSKLSYSSISMSIFNKVNVKTIKYKIKFLFFIGLTLFKRIINLYF